MGLQKTHTQTTAKTKQIKRINTKQTTNNIGNKYMKVNITKTFENQITHTKTHNKNNKQQEQY